MKKSDFSNISNLNVPENWIDNALNIPSTYTDKKQINFLRLSRVVTVAACVVIIGTISLSLFFTKNNDNILVGVKNTNSTQSDFSKTENPTYNSNTEIKIQQTPPHTVFDTQENTESTTHAIIIDSNETLYTEPTEQLITQSTLSTSEPHTEQERPETTSSSEATYQPTASQTSPTHSTGNFTDLVYICEGYYYPEMMVSDVMLVYCKLLDKNGNLVGDKNLFSSEHIASTNSQSDDYIYLYYHPAKAGLKLSSGKYTYYFYDKLGNELYKNYLYVN